MWADGDEQRPDANLTVQLLLHSYVRGLSDMKRTMTPSAVNMRYNGSWCAIDSYILYFVSLWEHYTKASACQH